MVVSIFNSTLFYKADDIKPEDAIKVRFQSFNLILILFQSDLKKMKTRDDFLNNTWDWRTLQDAYTALAYIHSFERESDDSFVGTQLHTLQKQNRKTKILDKIQVK